jgi:hypothetical protein
MKKILQKTKTNPRKIIRIFLLLFLGMCSTLIFAQVDPPPPSPDVVPISEYIFPMFALAVVYVGYFFHIKKKNSTFN